MCHADVIKSEIEKEFGIDFDSYFSEALKKLKSLETDGLIRVTKERLTPTAEGRVFLRNLAMPFDAYLPQPGDKKIFSRTV
jgi:oxygen-independent coproporphyrinogen-3 oxidase